MGARGYDRTARRLALVGLLVAAAACGSGGDAGSTTAGGQQGYGGRAWREARLGNQPNEVIVGFTGPDPSGGDQCVESYEPETYADAERGVLRIMLKVPHPMADRSCPTMPVEVTVELDEADAIEEGDILESGYSGYRYRRDGDHFELLPETTPCGRANCSEPSPTPSPCTTVAYRDAIEAGIDGNIFLAGEQRCDGSFLVTGIDVGSGGCPPEENQPSPCARVKTAYFVARDGGWGVVTYSADISCDDVAYSTEIRFPPALCG